MPSSAAPTTMKYVRLGNSGLKVSQLILGCMSYGDNTKWMKWTLGEKEALEHIKYAFDAGINTFDTANTYSGGDSEVLLGKAIKAHNLPREEIVILTKLFFPVQKTADEPKTGADEQADQAGYVNQYGSSRKNIFDSVDRSLARLSLDYIDVLQLHRFDYNTPISETMEALHDIVKSGKVRYIGMSSCFAYQFNQMQSYAIANKLTPFISMQNFHNAIYREEEREMLPTCQMFGVGVIPWSPLARGQLTRPVGSELTIRGQTDGAYKARGHDRPDESTVEIINRVEELAKKHNKSMAVIALAWSLDHPNITAPIVGTTSLKNLQDLIDGVSFKLTDEEINYINEPYKARGIIGHT